MKLFNNLPKFIKEETNLKTFKKTLKNSYTINHVTKLNIFWMMTKMNATLDSKILFQTSTKFNPNLTMYI